MAINERISRHRAINPEAYRAPGEYLVLAVTLLLVLGVVVLSLFLTMCTSLVFVAAVVLMAYASGRAHHQALIQQAYPVTGQSAPELDALVDEVSERLQPGPLAVFVAPAQALNAYTFGLESPKVIVVYSALLQVMDADELRFIIGHEVGHITLGHTVLNSLIGGVAGIPGSSLATAVLTYAFLSWNRACELSCDRAGLLACGSLEKAISALVKLVAGPSGLSRAGLERAYRQIDAEDDTWLGTLNETMASHPMLIRRINELRAWAASPDYQRLAAGA